MLRPRPILDAARTRRWRACLGRRRRAPPARAARSRRCCGRSATRKLAAVELVVLAPDVEPLLEQLRRHLGLHQVLRLGRALAHRLGGGGAARDADSAASARGPPTSVCGVRYGDSSRRSLRCSRASASMPSCAQRGGELLGGEAVDLVAAVGDEVEDEAQLAELLGEAAHLVVAHAGRVPVERRRQVVGEHLVGELGVDRVGELARVVRGRRSWSPSTACRRRAPRPATWRSRSRCRRGPGSSPRASWRARSPTSTVRRPARGPSSRASWNEALAAKLQPLVGAHRRTSRPRSARNVDAPRPPPRRRSSSPASACHTLDEARRHLVEARRRGDRRRRCSYAAARSSTSAGQPGAARARRRRRRTPRREMA